MDRQSRVVRPLWIEICSACILASSRLSRVVRPLWIEIEYPFRKMRVWNVEGRETLVD